LTELHLKAEEIYSETFVCLMTFQMLTS